MNFTKKCYVSGLIIGIPAQILFAMYSAIFNNTIFNYHWAFSVVGTAIVFIGMIPPLIGLLKD